MKRVSLFLLGVICLGLLTGCGGKRPEITEAAVSHAVSIITAYDHVRDAAVNVKGETVSLAVVANTAITQQYAKQLGDNFVRALGAGAATGNKTLAGPSKDTYGGLYKHYSVLIAVVGAGQNVIAEGAMNKGLGRITWR